VAIQDDPPILCVTDDVDYLSPDVWARREGIETPILKLDAVEPFEAAMKYLSRVPFPPDKLEYITINTSTEYSEYIQDGGQWKSPNSVLESLSEI